MRSIPRALATFGTALVLAACSGGTATTPPATSGPAATSGPPATAAAKVCADSTDSTDVNASVGGNEWGVVVAGVRDVITWTNSDAVPHKVALDDGSCAMSANIPGGGTKSLVFSVGGSFQFHCSVHPSMTGTITITYP